MNYEEMLKRAYEKLPKREKTERFEIPEPIVTLSGKFTIIQNFVQIANQIRRDPKHMAKFFFRELAIPGKLEGNKLILQRVCTKKEIETTFKDYYEEFLFCRECGKPDTRLIKRGNLWFLKCEACGAERGVRKI